MRGCIGTWAYPGGVLRARRRSVLGDTMRHFSVRILSSAGSDDRSARFHRKRPDAKERKRLGGGTTVANRD